MINFNTWINNHSIDEARRSMKPGDMFTARHQQNNPQAQPNTQPSRFPPPNIPPAIPTNPNITKVEISAPYPNPLLKDISDRNFKILSYDNIKRKWILSVDKTDFQNAKKIYEITTLIRKAKIPCQDAINEINNKKLSATYIPNGTETSSQQLPVWVNNNKNNSADIKLPVLLNNKKSQDIKDELYYIFFNKSEPPIRKETGLFVTGNSTQYYNAINLLHNNNFDTSEITKVYKEKDIQDTHDKPELHGNIKKETGGQKANQQKSFKAMVLNKIPYLKKLDQENKLKLYLKQYEGIAHLYSRKSAINGDETGVGKTFQFLVAAKLKMLDTNNKKKCLVITLKSVIDQLAQDITTLFGPDETNKIGYRIEDADTKDWIIVNYERFQSKQFYGGKNVDENKVTQFVKQNIENKFAVVVMDELHRIKSKESMRSQVLKDVVKAIPVKYGMTATLAANTAEDVKNQLQIIGHNLADVPNFEKNLVQNPALEYNTRSFNTNYATQLARNVEFKIINDKHQVIKDKIKTQELNQFKNQNPTENLFMYDDTTEPMTLMLADRQNFMEHDAMNKAQKMNRLLHITGVYDRKTKRQIRGNKLPKLNRHVATPDVSLERFCSNVKKEFEKIKSNPNSEQKSMGITKARKLIAMAKVKASAKRVKQICVKYTKEIIKEIAEGVQPYDKNREGHKVVVFTNFLQSAKQLLTAIDEKLAEFAKQASITTPLKAVAYNGKLSKSELAKNLKAFKTDPSVRVIVMTMQKGGTGIDFPNIAKNMVINDVFYTPESAEQAEGRIYRINTNKPPEIYYVVAKNIEIDKRIYETLKDRRRLAQEIQKSNNDYYKNGNEDARKDAIEKFKLDQQKAKNLDTTIEKEIKNICGMNENTLNPLHMTFKTFMMFYG